jgi:prevent-host-death family protein
MSQSAKTATIASTEAQTNFGVVIRRVYKNGEHLIVERGGLPVVVILPIGDYREFVSNRRGGEDNGSQSQVA